MIKRILFFLILTVFLLSSAMAQAAPTIPANCFVWDASTTPAGLAITHYRVSWRKDKSIKYTDDDSQKTVDGTILIMCLDEMTALPDPAGYYFVVSTITDQTCSGVPCETGYSNEVQYISKVMPGIPVAKGFIYKMPAGVFIPIGPVDSNNTR